MSRRFAQSVKLIVLIIGAFVMMFPFVWMLATSLKTLPESVAIPPILLPDTPQWSNYAEALRTAPFGLYFRNSILVAGLGTLLTLILTVLAAYAFTIYEFRGKTVFFFLCLATMMVPSELLIIQNFITISRLHWVNTFQGMIIPALASGFYIYMMREYFMQVPSVLYRAAKVDGCGDLRYILTILMPICKPIITTLFVQSFITIWNAYLWPLIITASAPDMRTIMVGITKLNSWEDTNYQLVLAGVTISLIPSFILFVIMRRNMAKGGTEGSLVG